MSENQQESLKSNGVHTPSMTTSSIPEQSTHTDSAHKANSQNNQKQVQLSTSDLQVIVMQSINNVNAKKDELTIAIKQLSDLATQLSKICTQQSEKLNK